MEIGLTNLQVSGHSQLVIFILQKLINGDPLEKVVKSWRLEFICERIQAHLPFLEYVIFEHVQRQGN